jgi:predicted transposase/invertase (TIGR01784 family)
MIPSLFPEPRALREAREEGREEGREEARQEIVINSLQLNIPLETIALVTDIPIAQLQQLQTQLPQE